MEVRPGSEKAGFQTLTHTGKVWEAYPCVVFSWFTRLVKGWLSPSEVRKWEEKPWEPHLTSDRETGS